MSDVRDPILDSSWEVDQARRLAYDTPALEQFWNDRFTVLYGALLDEIPEFGRHGVIAEYLQRLVPKGNILDVGCGTAPLIDILDHSRFTYSGVDISANALAIAKTRRSRATVEFRQSRIEDYTPDVVFNVIVFNEVLYYLDAQRALLRAVSWLNGGGIMVVSAFDFPEGEEAIQVFRSLIQVVDETVLSKPAHKLSWTIIVGRKG